ncbi:MAG TPA: EAL domain-containing protein [Cellvibrionaceae bacterium]|nr:EAL domain-containing protein [Cellvibrionaceae bacterium]
MAGHIGVLLHSLPVPMLLCDCEGIVLDINQRALAVLTANPVGVHLDQLLDFSRSDLVGCRTFEEVAEAMRVRSAELNVISLPINRPPVSFITVSFSFLDEGEETFILVGINDVSERFSLIKAFEYQQNLLDNILSTSTDALVVFDGRGCIELFSPAAESMFGRTSTEMIIDEVHTLFDAQCHQRVNTIFNHLKSMECTDEILVFEDLLPVNSLGEVFPASITFSRSKKESNPLFFMVVSDKSLFQRFINSVNDAYIKTDSAGYIIDLNNKAENLFHYDRRTLISKHISFLGIKRGQSQDVVSDIAYLIDGKGEEDYFAADKRGASLVLNLTAWPQEINNVRLNNLIVRDISQKKLAEKQLILSAFTDSLTGLSNRANFNRVLAEQIKEAEGTGKPFFLLVIDLDKFKEVNDSFGHDYGDRLLKAASKRLLSCVRDHDLVSRMGGDEFTIVLREIDTEADLLKVAQRILRTFRREFAIKEKRIFVSASVGVAAYPQDAQYAERLLKSADMAMYAAKRAGKDAFRLFTREMYVEYERHKLIERALQKAIVNNELALHFQPKISYGRQEVVGFEALLRWTTPELGFVSPLEFIPIAEENGCIIDLTRWVITQAVRSMAAWAQQCPYFNDRRLMISVNISVDHFKHDLYGDLQNILEREQFDPHLLEIEITEGTLLTSASEVVKTLNMISALGVQISIDDFGTGYSSLQYLKNFHLDTIKIDRAFVRDIFADPHNVLIVESIISIAKRMNLLLVAEGVESYAEIQHLVALGCDVFQGYFYSKPLPASEIPLFLASFTPVSDPHS